MMVGGRVLTIKLVLEDSFHQQYCNERNQKPLLILLEMHVSEATVPNQNLPITNFYQKHRKIQKAWFEVAICFSSKSNLKHKSQIYKP